MSASNLQSIGAMSLAHKAAARLRDEIRKGTYAVGQRLCDEHSLANKLGVSRGTLRQALKILDNERLIIRQQGRGTFVTNPTCGPVMDKQTALLGIMVWEKEYFFDKIIHAASARAAMRGYMLITGTNTTTSEERRHTEAFLENSVRGVAISPMVNEPRDNYLRLVKANVPVVMIDRTLPDLDEDFVSVDDYRGTYLAAKHLIKLGHRRIAYIGHNDPNDFPCQPRRYQGFRDACEQSGLAVPKQWRIQTDFQNAERPLGELLGGQTRPTAVVAFNDDWAVKVIKVAKQLRLAVPGTLSVVGFDDSAMGRDYDVPLTTINPRFEEIGKTVVDLLVDKIENPESHSTRNVLISPRLVVRGSTAAASAGA